MSSGDCDGESGDWWVRTVVESRRRTGGRIIRHLKSMDTEVIMQGSEHMETRAFCRKTD